MTLTYPLDLEKILITDLAGNPEIFSFIALILVGTLLAKAGFKQEETLFMFAIFGIIMATYLQGLFVIINLFGGLIIYSILKKIF